LALLQDNWSTIIRRAPHPVKGTYMAYVDETDHHADKVDQGKVLVLKEDDDDHRRTASKWLTPNEDNTDFIQQPPPDGDTGGIAPPGLCTTYIKTR